MEETDRTGALVAVRALIANLEAALIALVDPTIETYRLDTGQEAQSVTRRDIPRLTTDLEAAYALLAVLCVRGTGRGVVTVCPAY